MFELDSTCSWGDEEGVEPDSTQSWADSWGLLHRLIEVLAEVHEGIESEATKSWIYSQKLMRESCFKLQKVMWVTESDWT